MRAIITGINGFVGPYLERELRNGGYEVFGMGSEPTSEFERYFQADVRDREALEQAFFEIKPTHIFHLAGISAPMIAKENPELTHSVNVGGTKNVLEASLGLESKPRILVVSSSYVYGRPEYVPVDENHPINGGGVYGESRIQQEKLVAEHFDRLDIVIARSFNHTGPGRPEIFVVAKIVKHIVEIKKRYRKKLKNGRS